VTKSARKFDQKRHVSNKAMRGILEAAAQYPLPVDEILAVVGIDFNELNDIDGRMSHSQGCRIWQEITSRSGDPCIGLSLVEFAKPDTYDVLGYIASSCSNMSEALRRVAPYIKILHTSSILTFEVEKQQARITHTIKEPLIPTPAAYDQWVIATMVLFYRRVTGVDWTPLWVGFEHTPPEDIAPYHQFFRSPVKFEQPVNELVFDVEILNLPFQNTDSSLYKWLDICAKERLAKLPKTESFVDNIRQIIIEQLSTGDLSLVSIAETLGYSPRTLQRKFKELGLSYQKLLDEIRQEFAFLYLREDKISTSEIGYLLGFSEPSAFYRSFRRWTGKSPSEFRR